MPQAVTIVTHQLMADQMMTSVRDVVRDDVQYYRDLHNLELLEALKGANALAGRQETSNLRHTGFFNNTTTSLLVPLAQPSINVPVTYRQNATDADNHLIANVASAYAQDQLELSRAVQLIAGVRLEYFDLQYHNNRNGDELRRIDWLVSPRVGIVLKPKEQLSFYGTRSRSYLPSSGDQFSSLTTVTQQVQPERFDNYEAGAKWDVASDLALTMAVYRLDRTSTRATDPADPTRIVQTGQPAHEWLGDRLER